MKNILAFLLYCLSITAVIGQAAGETHLRVVSQTPDETVLRLDLFGTARTTVTTPRGQAVTISMQNGTPLLIAGAPDLPKYATALMIPAKGNMALEILAADYEDFTGVEVAPSKGDLKRNVDPSRIAYEYGGAYAKDEFFPARPADLQQPFVLRDARGQALWLYPVRYNPVTKTLRVYSSMTVRIYAAGGAGQNELQAPGKRAENRTFQQLYQKLFVNYNTSIEKRGGWTPEKMLVIAKDEFLEALEPLVIWKRQMGIETTVVPLSEIGSSESGAIYNYVQQYYAQHGITYLLLVGDEYAIHPEMRSDGGSYSCDNCFGYMDGSDHFPEVFVGRFNAATLEQVKIMVNRNLEYEKNPLADSLANWTATGMASSSDQGQGIGDDNQADYEQCNDWKAQHLADGYEKWWEFYEGNHAAISPTPGDETADQAGDPVNTELVKLMNGRGVSLYNYCGHGWEQGLVSGNFNTDAVAQLRNEHKFPLLIAVACCAGNFTNNSGGDCLGEAWQRAGNLSDGTPYGGIAGFFSSDFQSWAPPMEGQDGMNQMLIDADGITLTPHISSLLAFGNAKMIAAYAGGGETMADFWNPFAEPSTVPRTRLPLLLTAQHTTGVFLGESSLTVTSPVEGALISLYWQGQTLAVGIIENGSATLNFPSLANVGDLTVTATQFNYIPYQGNVVVTPASGAFVVNQAVTLDDPTGNANGKADFGESIQLHLSLANVGLELAKDASAVLSTSDEEVTLVDGEETFGDLAVQEVLEKKSAFLFKVNDDVVNGHVVNFNLKITYNNNQTYETTVQVKLLAPALAIGSLKITDPLGDQDGHLENGETVTITIENTNIGQSTSTNAVGVLTSDSPWLTIAGPAPMGPLSVGGANKNAVFTVTVAPDAPQVVEAQFYYKVSADAYDAEKSFGPYIINPVIETFETKNFNTFPWLLSGNKPWVIVSTSAFTGTTSARSGAITHNQKSQMTLTLNVSKDGLLSFARRVSCESDYDYLRFYMDGSEVDKWTGDVAWGEVSYPVTAGMHTFLWSYEKDGIGSAGSDRAWVDEVSLPAYKVSVGTGAPTLQNTTLQLSPNPSSGSALLTLNLTEGKQMLGIQVLDYLGRLVSVPLVATEVSGGYFSQDLDLNSLPAGVYLVQVRTEAGILAKKMVKE